MEVEAAHFWSASVEDSLQTSSLLILGLVQEEQLLEVVVQVELEDGSWSSARPLLVGASQFQSVSP